MANDLVKLEILNENKDKHLDSEIERIFGKPSAPNNNAANGFLGSEINQDLPYNGLNGESYSGRTTQPLLEAPRDRPLPPLAGPEIDDLDGDPPKDANPFSGIDDGLLEPADSKPDAADPDDGEHDPERDSGEEHHTLRTNLDGVVGTDGKTEWEHDEPDYPYDLSGLGPRFGIDDRGVSPIPGIVISLEIRSPGRSGLTKLKFLVVFLPKIVLNILIFFISFFKVLPDVNTYQQKKNLAQGMMDLALLSANANQLRYVLESSTTHPYYYSSVVFISLSIIFQILVGVGLIMNSRYDVNNHKEICKADKINNMTVLGIFLITIVNVFITSFSVATPTGGSMLRGQLTANVSARL